MQTEERFEREFLPKLRQKLASEFKAAQPQDPQQEQNQRNFFIRWAIKTKNLAENCVAFLLTMAFFIPLWMFKIGLNGLDLIEKWVRFVVWLYVKALILIVNFVFKLLNFFKITSAVNFIKKIVKTYLGTYTVEEFDKDGQDMKTNEKQRNKKENQLIDVKKVEKKIRTPNIFLTHQQTSRPTFLSLEGEQYRQKINQELVPERSVQYNIVETSHRIKNPILTGLSESHQRLKRVATEPRIHTSASLELQIPSSNRQNTTPLSQSHRIQPDRDVSPSFYQKQNFKVTESSFKKKETPEKQILLTHHHPILQGTYTQKHELQVQLLNLRTKMSELIEDNNNDIHELERWIRQKSQTITMTRKQNMELLSQIQELQQENIKKTKAFVELEEKIKDMEKTLQKERILKNGLNEQVQKLEEEIKVKTIEIMSLKDKIKTNFEHLQRMESIFGPEKIQFEKSPFKEEYLIEIQSPELEENLAKPLIADLMSKEKDRQVQVPILGNPSENEASNVKTIGQSLNEQEIEELDTKVEFGSEKQIIEVPLLGDEEIHETKSTSAVEQHVEENLEEKIIEEQEIVDKMMQKVEETLKKEQEKLQKFEHQKTVLLEQVLQKQKPFKEPKLMQQEKQAEWMQQKEKDSEGIQEDKKTQRKELGYRRSKNKKKKR